MNSMEVPTLNGMGEVGIGGFSGEWSLRALKEGLHFVCVPVGIAGVGWQEVQVKSIHSD